MKLEKERQREREEWRGVDVVFNSIFNSGVLSQDSMIFRKIMVFQD